MFQQLIWAVTFRKVQGSEPQWYKGNEPVDNSGSQVSSPSSLNNVSANDLDVMKKHLKVRKGDQSLSSLNVSPRGPRVFYIDDLITIINNLQNSEEDINIEDVLTNLEGVPDHLNQELINEGQSHEVWKAESNNKKGKKNRNTSVVTRAHSKKQ